jgi:hypothetical protein
MDRKKEDKSEPVFNKDFPALWRFDPKEFTKRLKASPKSDNHGNRNGFVEGITE